MLRAWDLKSKARGMENEEGPPSFSFAAAFIRIIAIYTAPLRNAKETPNGSISGNTGLC
jgi:hypothetical protein